ncbi:MULTISPECIES: cation diffusion facilitator family transporter [unclassified Paenibacillus]|uniref:cation diffusion facilitator family transporter n=1 Tax=unclassified Paenibacillus TaxID=185978 RepID=UPI001046175B|nr:MULTISPECIES: cation diffusion facilitator family transporter [unclassified Paenibacillus]NIK70325.1 cation diffusion facilitator family transporter [Paenibacillus sp. BK720]TCM90751.1 cation diffusion facilitator family transporter [Paenibacillus sp. BK033]
MNQYEEIKQGEKGALVSIGAYIGLSAIKLGAGYWFASGALVADGFNNLTDIIASVAVLIGLRISQKPPDKDHPYGHFRAETIAALIASFIMATVGLQVIINTVRSLFSGQETVPSLTSAWVALFAAACMGAVYLYNRRLASRINNQALHAAAKDNLSDTLVSIGAAVGIIGAQFGLPWLDPVAALAVGAIICKTAWDIFYSSTHALTDGFDAKELMTLRSTIEGTKGVKSIKDIKARVHGSNVLIDVIVQVDPGLTLIESHGISDEIERRMEGKHNIMSVHVHVEPHEEPYPGSGPLH